ncbi:MAG: 50S ribosomal protein L9 [Planctomycetota bacterium]|nr:50S ribosomal protein L9 [Planctomycetota bacterium]
MKLVLRESIDDLGEIGDIVEVATGYGRNFLIPQGKAVTVSPENLRQLQVDKKRLIAEEDERKRKFQSLADQIRDFSLTIQMQANEEGVLYGSVTAQVIAEGFTQEGITVEARTVLLEKPIKELGVYPVIIRLYAGVEVETKIWIVESDRPEDALSDGSAPTESPGDEPSGDEAPAPTEGREG